MLTSLSPGTLDDSFLTLRLTIKIFFFFFQNHTCIGGCICPPPALRLRTERSKTTDHSFLTASAAGALGCGGDRSGWLRLPAAEPDASPGLWVDPDFIVDIAPAWTGSVTSADSGLQQTAFL